jgi:hypothetical protein
MFPGLDSTNTAMKSSTWSLQAVMIEPTSSGSRPSPRKKRKNLMFEYTCEASFASLPVLSHFI